MPAFMPQAASQNGNPLAKMMFTDEDRLKHIKTIKLAWYPAIEPAIKDIESLEGSSTTLIDSKAYIIGGFSNQGGKIFFQYSIE